jgi:hypothetical protein
MNVQVINGGIFASESGGFRIEFRIEEALKTEPGEYVYAFLTLLFTTIASGFIL